MTPLKDRFMGKVDLDGPMHFGGTRCWLWQGKLTDRGYGTIKVGGKHGKNCRAHRVSYELFVGPIPAGLTIDHLCRNRSCVNPLHLEPVTQGENTRRSPYTLASIHASRTHCPHGHEYTEENTYLYNGRRSCRPCNNKHTRAYKARLRAAIA